MAHRLGYALSYCVALVAYLGDELVHPGRAETPTVARARWTDRESSNQTPHRSDELLSHCFALTAQLGDALVHPDRAELVHPGRAELGHPSRTLLL